MNQNSCISCYKCFENKDQHCSLNKDELNGFIDKILEAEGLIWGSPTYFINVSTEMKALIDRVGLVGFANEGMYRHKVAAAVTAVFRTGAMHAFDAMNRLFFCHEMVLPASNYPNMGMGMHPGEVEKDEQGMRTMQVLGRNMAWLMKKLYR